MAKIQQPASNPAPNMTMLNGAYEVNGKPIGPIYLQDSAMVALVKKIVLNTDGVSRLAGGSFLDSLGELVGNNKIRNRAITISRKTGKSLTVTISICIFIGVKIPALVEQIVSEINNSVYEMAGIRFSTINVNVQDMEERPETASDDSESGSEN